MPLNLNSFSSYKISKVIFKKVYLIGPLPLWIWGRNCTYSDSKNSSKETNIENILMGRMYNWLQTSLLKKKEVFLRTIISWGEGSRICLLSFSKHFYPCPSFFPHLHPVRLWEQFVCEQDITFDIFRWRLIYL